MVLCRSCHLYYQCSTFLPSLASVWLPRYPQATLRRNQDQRIASRNEPRCLTLVSSGRGVLHLSCKTAFLHRVRCRSGRWIPLLFEGGVLWILSSYYFYEHEVTEVKWR
jgi:hypothetical protein